MHDYRLQLRLFQIGSHIIIIQLSTNSSKLNITPQFQIRKILYNKVCALGVPIIFVNVNYSLQAPNLYSSTGYESKSKCKFTLNIYC